MKGLFVCEICDKRCNKVRNFPYDITQPRHPEATKLGEIEDFAGVHDVVGIKG